MVVMKVDYKSFLIALQALCVVIQSFIMVLLSSVKKIALPFKTNQKRSQSHLQPSTFHCCKTLSNHSYRKTQQ